MKTKISLVIHHRELKRTTNTGRLAVEALVNSEMSTRGLKDHPLDLSDLLVPEYETLLLSPVEGSIPLTEEFIKKIKKPIQLIVPDGNWRQSSKVNTRHPELVAIPRVKIDRVNKETRFLRKETTEIGMATLQAIAYALGIIEGESVQNQLLELYRHKLERTLLTRGVKA